MYKTYADIPDYMQSYFLILARADKIEDVPLSDINSYMDMMNENDKNEIDDEWKDGWVM